MSSVEANARPVKLLQAQELRLLRFVPLKRPLTLPESACGMDTYRFYCRGLNGEAKSGERNTSRHEIRLVALERHLLHRCAPS